MDKVGRWRSLGLLAKKLHGTLLCKMFKFLYLLKLYHFSEDDILS